MKHRALVLNAAILVLGFAVAVVAQSTEIEQLRLAAEQGEAEAQFNLWVRYYSGQGVPQDYQEAVRWLRLQPKTWEQLEGRAGERRFQPWRWRNPARYIV